MESIKSKIDEFLKTNPNLEGFLRDYIEKAKAEINKEIEKEVIKEIILETKNTLEYDVGQFKKPFHTEFKYKLEQLESSDSEFKIFEGSLNLERAQNGNSSLQFKLNETKLKLKDDKTTLKIYRVIPTAKVSTQSSSSSSSQVLLLHGTKAPNVEGILKTGYKPSQKGSRGAGVYLTDSIDYAYNYGNCFAQEQGTVKKFSYVFVNKIKQADVQDPAKHFQSVMSFQGVSYYRINKISYDDYLKMKPIVKVFNHKRKLVEFEDTRQDKFDIRNGKILGGTFQKDFEQSKIALAHHDLVVPVYLIEVEEVTNVKEIVEQSVCRQSGNMLFNKSEKVSKDGKTLKKVPEHTLEIVTKELEKVVNANQLAKCELLKLKLDRVIILIMDQLSFKLSSIFKNEVNENTKYKTEVLQKENDDYKFILRSLEAKNDTHIPKILHIVKINPIDKNELTKLKDKCLYLTGINPNKIKNILKWGLYQKCNEKFDPDLNFASTNYEEEVTRGLSYCEVGGTVKQLSFILVSSSHDNYCCTNTNKEYIEDSRGSRIDVGLFRANDDIMFRKIGLIPAYVIVVEVE